MDEQDKERKEKHKEWMRKKDEEMRRKLMKVVIVFLNIYKVISLIGIWSSH
jgi:hypothetical protein